MGVLIFGTGAGARLEPCELDLLAQGATEQGRATLLVPTFAERDVCRRELAQAGGTRGARAFGAGIEVSTPAAWIAALWELFGDGRQLAGNFERQALIAALLDARSSTEIAPLKNNPGTIRLLARMARDLAPYAGEPLERLRARPDTVCPGAETAAGAPDAALTAADAAVLGLLEEYRAALGERGLVEASEAAELLSEGFARRLPACARFVAVRDVTTVPAYLYRLLAAVARGDGGGAGSVAWLLGAAQEPFEGGLLDAFARAGCREARAAHAVAAGRADAATGAAVDAAAPVQPPVFLEVAGPHAKAAAYAGEVLRLQEGAPAGEGEVVVVSPRPAECFFELSPRLAAAGVASRARLQVQWGESLVGQQFTALTALAQAMERAGDDPLRAGEWWPAPALSDWLASPLSGVDIGCARAFDKKIRGHRSLTVEQVQRELQSIQGRQRAARAKLPPESAAAKVPAVCADVFQAICQKRPVSALKGMLEVARALPARAFGTHGGQARKQVECAVAEAACAAVGDRAHALGVSQAVAVTVLDSLRVQLSVDTEPEDEERGAEPADAGAAEPVDAGVAGAAVNQMDGASAPDAASEPGGRPGGAQRPESVRFLKLEEAALLPAGGVRGILFADVDTEAYPLKRAEGLELVLAERLGRAPVVMEPAVRQKALFSRAIAVPVRPAVLARVTHDRQAQDRYPAAIWTELLATSRAAGRPAVLRTCDEAALVEDFDPAAGAGRPPRRERVACLPPQELAPQAVPYLVLTQRDAADPQAPVRRTRLSASQIESYCTCPLCWFMGSRVRPQAVDAGFGGMEEGNFVHDVMERFHRDLLTCGIARVTPENLGASLTVLRTAFDAVAASHAQGKTSTSGALVPLSMLEELQLEEVYPPLEAAVRYEAGALPPFQPVVSEYAFDGQGVSYAGRPLGGRIDRVDADAAGRAVVIDYKHRSNVDQFKLKDPTVADKKTGARPADDPAWLPEHTQALIYAQALRRVEVPLDTRGALYFSTKGSSPAMRGAVSAELAGMVPGLKEGFPAEDEGGTMGFDELLERVEAEVGRRLDEMEAGRIQAAPDAPASCAYQHPLGFMKREA